MTPHQLPPEGAEDEDKGGGGAQVPVLSWYQIPIQTY